MTSVEIRTWIAEIAGLWPYAHDAWKREGYLRILAQQLKHVDSSVARRAVDRWGLKSNREPTIEQIMALVDEIMEEQRLAEARQPRGLPSPEQVAQYSQPQDRETDKLIAKEALGMINALLNSVELVKVPSKRGYLGWERVPKAGVTLSDCAARCRVLAEQHPELRAYWLQYAETLERG